MALARVAHDRSTWERLAGALRPEGRALIDGKLSDAIDGRRFDDVSPIDGRVICQVARGDAKDIDKAVQAARATFSAGVWRKADPFHRKRVLLRFAELIRNDTEHLALLETLDVGKPIVNSTDVDVTNCANCIAYYAEFADKLYDEIAPTPANDVALIKREPLGVVAAIVPWNYPLIISAWRIGAGILSGNFTVFEYAWQSRS